MKRELKTKLKNKGLRLNRTRKRIKSLESRPRLTVFRSLKHFYMQIIDDAQGRTLAAASDLQIKDLVGKKPMEVAAAVGTMIAEKAKAKQIEAVVYDRGAYQYHGLIKAAAEAARQGGLKF